MARLIPFTLMTEARVLSALRLRAGKEGRSLEEVASDILHCALTAEIEESAGVPPLAEIIQQHHDQQAAKGKSRPSRTSGEGAAPVN